MNTSPTAQLADTVVALYETVRACMVSAPSWRTGERGLAVLVHRGMLTWCHACAPMLAPARATPVPVDATRVSMDCHDELIDVMVTMAMTSSVWMGWPLR